MSLQVLIAAGGTAGHVYPGLALAAALRQPPIAAEVSFVGTSRGIEKDAVPRAGYSLDLVEVVPWARTLGVRRYLAPASLVGAVGRARKLLRRLHPDAVAGMGGYASLPVAIAARSAGIATVLHEQNAVPGIANRIGSRFARRVALSFGEAGSGFPGGVETRLVGNPIRAEIAALNREAAHGPALDALELTAGRRTVLVMGGSLGAARLNDAAVGLVERWRNRSDRQMLVAAGRAHGEGLRERITAARPGDLLVRCVDYLDRVEDAYAAADVAICRAGAATVAELAAVGLPAVLVPYPYARANHQEANARAAERAGAATVILDADATAAAVGDAVERMLDDDAVHRAMSSAARGMGRPWAAADLAAWVAEIAGGRPRG